MIWKKIWGILWQREREREHSPAVELIFVPKCEREGGSGTRETLNRRFVSRVTFFHA